MLRSPELAEPVTPEHLQKNMSHGGLRLDRMRFAEYQWSERRYYWHNDDGSHHFSAARYQAGRLQLPVPLTGTLHHYSVNVQMVPALRNKWQMFVIPKEELFGSFYESMKAFESPFAWSALPGTCTIRGRVAQSCASYGWNGIMPEPVPRQTFWPDMDSRTSARR
ncbi:DUF6685 family protein [Leclercia adecarboxylata]|uniref:DUF6685 family protein n=1 Tax=Enterobacteriaceae TaxID=543 RepID=UPI0020C9C609|nr:MULTISPECIES: DUF6685 family protein [Enterobacteriaceae]MCW4948699.1 hypothetical protein [Enterobacter hormaechei subsp. xiangfangensis]